MAIKNCNNECECNSIDKNQTNAGVHTLLFRNVLTELNAAF